MAEALSRTPAADPLAVLLAFERLEVGPVRLDPDRLTCPYRVIRADGSADGTELVYRYEEPVFSPGSPDDENLAAIIAAQVALNYGLFCREILFRGPFDSADRRLLQDMIDNTSREIFVGKILTPNPFLRPPAVGLPPLRRNRYTRATLRFEGEDGGRRPPEAPWETDPGRYTVLSSGGKDSLLSFGLLRELGYETHPIFVNESGRHWFTALNAYRHFSAPAPGAGGPGGGAPAVPGTARVWTSCDRLFTWMLRHLPFIRPDFQDIRADIYPIRLWTVAVFLFGALPLMKKRGIGRLVIGDEYDTTLRVSHEGIPHYGGLYDQSRFFDNTLSRYFQRKGWGITQLSLLRPLSELLIEKILAERYPDLLTLQVSCHAAHKDGEWVRPCGQCEKCGRITSMLLAFGADPGRCGYTPEQVRAILATLPGRELHQEAVLVQHVAHLLHEKGLLAAPHIGSEPARPRPEAVRLRIHPERSPVEEIPVPLRRGLFQIFLEHAAGAVKRVGRQWLPFDPLSDPAMLRPYLFDHPQRSGSSGKGAPVRAGGAEEPGADDEDGALAADYPATPALGKILWGELTWPEARERTRLVDVALLPVGAVEQHGPHLPLDVDAFDADLLCRRVAEAATEPRPLVLPLIPYGVSYHHDDFPGTLSVTNETLSRMVYEIGMAAARNGITKLVIINGHGGNAATLHFAAQMINRDAHIFTTVDTGETSDSAIYALAETPNDVHAGEIETSTTLAVRPDLVQMDRAESFVPRFSSEYLEFTAENAVDWNTRTQKISPSGILGDPTRASREKGEEIWRLMIHHLVELVEHLKSMSLDEIYQRRY